MSNNNILISFNVSSQKQHLISECMKISVMYYIILQNKCKYYYNIKAIIRIKLEN